MTLLLMAAGKGSRYGKLKQFDALGPNGEFLMEYSIKDAIASGFIHIVVITQEENVKFLETHLRERIPVGIKLDVIPQKLSELPHGLETPKNRQKPWGTAHAVWCARNVIKTPFAVINADDYYGKTVYEKVMTHINKSTPSNNYLLVGYRLKDTLSENGSVSRGVCKLVDDTKLKSVVEYLKLEQRGNVIIDMETKDSFNGDEMVSMNFWVCQPDVFNFIEDEISYFFKSFDDIEKGEIYLPMVIQKLLKEHRIKVNVLPSNDNWFGVTYSNDRAMAVDNFANMTKDGMYPTPLW